MSKTTTSTEYGSFGQIMRRVTLRREGISTRRVAETWEYDAFGREICYTEETDYQPMGQSEMTQGSHLALDLQHEQLMRECFPELQDETDDEDVQL